MSGAGDNGCVSDWIAFLEMNRKPVFHASKREGFEIFPAARDWLINREWYRRVGADWGWQDRLKRSEADWREYVESDDLETWIASFEGAECGYFELLREGNQVRIALLGLRPEFIGKGLGGALLLAALEKAWTGETGKVFLDTCGKDHPNALPNYLRHGFRIIRTEFADGFEIG